MHLMDHKVIRKMKERTQFMWPIAFLNRKARLYNRNIILDAVLYLRFKDVLPVYWDLGVSVSFHYSIRRSVLALPI